MCTGVRPVFCNRACCWSCTDDLSWLKSARDAKDRLMLVQGCLCISWSCSHLLFVVSRCQLLLCSRQIVAVLESRGVFVCWRSWLYDSYKIVRDVMGRTRMGSCFTRTQWVCVLWLRITHAFVLWYHGSVLQLGLTEYATMLYSARLWWHAIHFSVVKSMLWVGMSSWCFYAVNASACTWTLFTFACCICVCM